MPRKKPPPKPTDRELAQRIVAAVLGAVGSSEPAAGLPLLLKHKTAAAMLSIDERSLTRLVAGGHITPVKTPIAGRFYALEDLTAYVARCKETS